MDANLNDINITTCVYPFHIFSSKIQFNNISMQDILGSDAAIDIQLSSGTWSNLRFGLSSISLMNSSIWMVESRIYFTNAQMISLSNSWAPLGRYINSNVTFESSLFYKNIGSVIGGMDVSNRTLLTIINSHFVSNNGRSASVIRCTDSFLTIINTRVSENIASSAASILLNHCQFKIINSTFVANNQAPTLGLYGSTGSLISARFINSSASDSIIDIGQNSNVYIETAEFGSFFSLNDGSYSDMTIDNSHVIVVNGLFSGNLGINKPTLSASLSNINITNCIFVNNSNIYGIGGDIFLNETTAFISNTSFTSGGAHLGGCIYAETSRLEGEDLIFDGCASTAGGSLFLKNSPWVTLKNCVFVSTIAKLGDYTNSQDLRLSSYQYNGGAISIFRPHSTGTDTSFIFLEHCNFTNTFAFNDGGSIWASDQYASIHIHTSTYFSGNLALGGGGGIFNEESSILTISNNTIYKSNSASYGENLASNIMGILFDISDNTIQHGIPFIITTQMVDRYNQTVNNRPDLSFGLLITNATNTTTPTTISKDSIGFLGQTQFSITLDGQPGDTYLVQGEVLDTDLATVVSATINITIVGCLNQTQYILDGICTLCPVGTIGYDGVTCYTCPPETTCPTGQISPLPGYWFETPISNIPIDIYRCDPTVCITGGCRQYHQGPLCGQCQEGTAKSLIVCNPCTHDNVAIIIVYVVFNLALAIFIARINIPSRTIIFAMITTLQLLAIVGERQISFFFFSIFNFRIDFWPTSCVFSNSIFNNYLAKYLLSVSIIICTIFLALILPILNRTRRLLRIVYSPAKLPQRFYSLLLLFYTPLSYLSATVIPCKTVGDTKYLIIDQEVECYGSLHVASVTVAVFIIIFVTFGLPIMLYRKRIMLRPLFLHFKKTHRYFDAAKQCVAFLFTWSSATLPFYESQYALILFAISLVYIALIIKIQPFISNTRMLYETWFACSLTLTTMIINSRNFQNSQHQGYPIMGLCIAVVISTAIYLIQKQFRKKKLFKI
ncbi:hypothetical protein DFA_08811 [Cavenderia fasciculata]|uniref:Uncharacterized protein n=1 Tax=Cavenderia fasciculata TaxID=261658 RepID=F4Q4G2_CACFS|nr:uncharacterized protein DFA_08811 [Cavenderia fasciculata]EGG17811.1 hypothetical protein DFA_08811 [Cavenderia fasciculata]|eukprot:XP_004356295.1 hypothetical protein DFA_08811 [Cavenderia fasciculata]